MLKIAICDDEIFVVEEIQSIAVNYLLDEGVKCEIETFDDGIKLWEAYNKGQNYDLVFLDINMEEMDGINLGKRIRENFQLENNQIVYVSSERERAEELLEIRVFGFIYKGALFQSKIKEILKKCMEIKIYNTEFIMVVDNDGDKIKNLLSDIKYFEAKDKKVFARVENNEYIVRKSLTELEDTLPKRKFVRIKDSLIINGDKVKTTNYKSVTMNDGEIFTISQTFQVEVGRYFKKR